MSFSKPAGVKIYDNETGRRIDLESLITRLGILAVAKKYGVTESAVRKWRKKARKPSRGTIAHSLKRLF